MLRCDGTRATFFGWVTKCINEQGEAEFQSVCMDITEEEWSALMSNLVPFDNFVAYSEAPYEKFTELLRSGEAEFTYFDYQLEAERKMKAICSEREPNSNSPRYVMLYSVENTEVREKKKLTESRTVSIRTFGYFDVFVVDKPIAFRNKKEKYSLCLL